MEIKPYYQSDNELVTVARNLREGRRLRDRSLEDVVESWDEIIGEPVSTRLLDDNRNIPAREMVGLYLKIYILNST